MQDPKWGTVSHQNKMEQKYWLLWWVFYEGFPNDATWLKENKHVSIWYIFHAWYFMPIFWFSGGWFEPSEKQFARQFEYVIVGSGTWGLSVRVGNDHFGSPLWGYNLMVLFYFLNLGSSIHEVHTPTNNHIPWKMPGWKTMFLLKWPPFHRDMSILGGVSACSIIIV